MATKKTEIKIDPLDELFGISASAEGRAMVKIEDIHPFKDHPFKVADDEKMMFLHPCLHMVFVRTKVPFILLSQYSNGCVTDSPTAFSPAKCMQQSKLCLENIFSKAAASRMSAL